MQQLITAEGVDLADLMKTSGLNSTDYSTGPVLSTRLRLSDDGREKLDQLIDEYVSDEISAGRRNRRLGGKRDDYHRCVEALIANHIATGLRGRLGIHRNSHFYSRNAYLLPDWMTRQGIYFAMDFMAAKNADRVVLPGRKDFGHGARITQLEVNEGFANLSGASPSCLQLEPETDLVRLKDTKKKNKRRLPIPPELAEAAKGDAYRLQSLNAAHRRSEIKLAISETDFLLGLASIKSPWRDRRLLEQSTCLHRVFNNGTLEEGGRLFGGFWQQIPKEWRRSIHIEGQPTVELDYSAIAISCVYALEGIQLEGDPYDIGLPNVPRSHRKEALNSILNAKSINITAPKQYETSVFGIEWRDLLRLMMKAHPRIAHHFLTGVGLRLQRIESDIALDVVEHFTSKEVACLPIHDSFRVQVGYRQELEAVMRCVYQKRMGKSIAVKEA